MRRVMLVALAGLLVGCVKQVPEPVEVAPAPPEADAPPANVITNPKFAMIPKQKDNPVFAYAKLAAERRAKELGCEVLWDAPPQNDEAKQALLVEAFAEQGVDGIAISCSNPDTLKTAIDRASDLGIPVVTWDSDSPQSKRQAFYGINDYSTGQLLGEELVALLPDGGKVALLSGVQGAENLEQRLRGAKEALAKQANIEVVTTLYCDDDIPRSVQLVSDVMDTYPNLAGLLMVGGWPLFANNGLSDLTPGRTKVVAVDPLPEAQHWISDGYVQVCVGQKIFGWGSESINLLYDLVQGKPIQGIDDQGFVDSGVDIVVNEKIGRYEDPKYTALADYQKQFEELAAEPSEPSE